MLAPTFVETPMTVGIVPELRRKGMRFASVESVAGVVGRLVGERDVNGRFVLVFSVYLFYLDCIGLRISRGASVSVWSGALVAIGEHIANDWVL